MSAKEQLLDEAPSFTEEQAERALRAVHGEPPDSVDEWGDVDTMLDEAAGDLMAALDEEERAEHGETIAEAWGRTRRVRRPSTAVRRQPR